MDLLAPGAGHPLEELRAGEVDQPFPEGGLSVELGGERADLLRLEIDQEPPATISARVAPAPSRAKRARRTSASVRSAVTAS